VLDVLKFVNAPGSLTLLALCLLVGVTFLYVWPRSRRLAKRWLLAVTGVYLVLGLPITANTIVNSLPPVPREPHDDEPGHTLILFDGDNRRGRLETTLAEMRRDRPGKLWVLADEWLVEGLIRGGYPRGTFGHDSECPNTRAQVEWVRSYATRHPGTGLTVIASRLQLPRIAALFDTAGLPVRLVASPIDVEPPTRGWRTLVPSYYALRASRDALYEHAALRYYRWQGWIRRLTVLDHP
jgi:hypothetical protein